MKNRNFGYLDAENKIVYADDFAEINGVIYTSPTAEHYARMNPPHLPIDSAKPEKDGAYFISTEYGDLVDDGLFCDLLSQEVGRKRVRCCSIAS